MREVFSDIEAWRKEGKTVAIATNVKKEGASLRPLGGKMAMTTTHQIAGSVTGGCIEGAVYEEAQEVIKTGVPKLLHYGVVNNDTPWEIGLSCGGTLDVFVETLDSPAWREIYPQLKISLDENRLSVVATVISGPSVGSKLMLWPDGREVGSLGSAELNQQTRGWMQNQMAVQENSWTTLYPQGEPVEVFADVLVPPAKIIVIGAVHIAIPLVTLAKSLGYYTIVIDPRAVFCQP